MRLPLSARGPAPAERRAGPAISKDSGSAVARLGLRLQPRPKLTGRLRELDALRGLAAITVMLYHYTTRYDEIYKHLPGLPFRVGEGSVLLVFMITGFAITMSLAKKSSWTDFAVARVGRLYPVYWVSILVTHEVVFRFGLPGREVGLGATVANMTMVQHFVGIADVDGAYWTLAVQLCFYSIVGLLLFTGQFKDRVRCCAIWLTTLYLVAGIDKFIYPVPAAMRTLMMLDFGSLFIGGIMFYCLYAEARSKYSSTAVIVGCLVFDYLFHDGRTFALSVVFYATFFLLSLGQLKWLASKPLDYFASIAYPLYLLHQQIGYVVIREAYHFGVTSPLIAIACAIIVSVSLATLLSVWVERPAMLATREAQQALDSMDPLSLPPGTLDRSASAAR
jgi:peptidoglycan/LPS O-acetylase OafA/YrhL